MQGENKQNFLNVFTIMIRNKLNYLIIYIIYEIKFALSYQNISLKIEFRALQIRVHTITGI